MPHLVKMVKIVYSWPLTCHGFFTSRTILWSSRQTWGCHAENEPFFSWNKDPFYQELATQHIIKNHIHSDSTGDFVRVPCGNQALFQKYMNIPANSTSKRRSGPLQWPTFEEVLSTPAVVPKPSDGVRCPSYRQVKDLQNTTKRVSVSERLSYTLWSLCTNVHIM